MSQDYTPPQPGPGEPGHQPPATGYEPPAPGHQPPPPGYQTPPPGYQAPPPGYQAAPPGYQPPPVGFQDPGHQGQAFPPPAPGTPGYGTPGYGEAAYGAPGYPPPPAAPAKLGDKPAVLWVALGAGLLAIVGSFMPWVTVSAPIIGDRSVAGTEAWDGWFTLFLGLALAAWAGLALSGRQLPRFAPRIAAGVAVVLLLLTVWNIFDVQSAKKEMQESLTGEPDPFGLAAELMKSIDVSVGVGLYLLLLAGLAGVAAMAVKLFR